ncbi:nickel/cobalt transporter [Pseudochelatococcus sp. B33]
MSDTTVFAASPRSALRDVLVRTAVAVLALALVGGLFVLLSQMGAPVETPPAPRHPFSAGLNEAAPEPVGIGGAILAIQSAFYTRMIAALQAFSTETAAFWTLVALSFAYGIFHAAGPGHGKAVISGYLVADGRRSIGRGLALAFASSILQALSAIAIVGVMALVLNATAATVNATARVIEQASFVLVAVVGLVVLWRKAGRLATLMRVPAAMEPMTAEPASAVSADSSGDPFAGLAFRPAGEAGSGRFRAEAVEERDAPAACDDPSCRAGGFCAHTHLLTPAELGRIDSLRDMAMVALSAGLRPCTGAIIVLVFAFAQGMPTGGLAAAFAMALGTFITVGALASLAVFAKRLATGLATGMTGESSRTGVRAIAALEVLASAAVAVIGVVLVLG